MAALTTEQTNICCIEQLKSFTLSI